MGEAVQRIARTAPHSLSKIRMNVILMKQDKVDDPKGFAFTLNHNGEILDTIDSFNRVLQMQVERNVILVGLHTGEKGRSLDWPPRHAKFETENGSSKVLQVMLNSKLIVGGWKNVCTYMQKC